MGEESTKEFSAQIAVLVAHVLTVLASGYKKQQRKILHIYIVPDLMALPNFNSTRWLEPELSDYTFTLASQPRLISPVDREIDIKFKGQGTQNTSEMVIIYNKMSSKTEASMWDPEYATVSNTRVSTRPY